MPQACRSEILHRMGSAWDGGRRLIQPAELAKGLPMTEPGGTRAAVKDAMHFADLLR